jgi:transcriptional regulator with XRE-family HTH domain
MNRIREIRTAQNKKVSPLAEKLGVTPKHFYDLETGSRRLNEDHIRVLCQEFNVSSDYLLGLSDNPASNKFDFNYNIIFQQPDRSQALLVASDLRFRHQLRDDIFLKMTREIGDFYNEKEKNPPQKRGELAAHGPKTPGSRAISDEKIKGIVDRINKTLNKK